MTSREKFTKLFPYIDATGKTPIEIPAWMTEAEWITIAINRQGIRIADDGGQIPTRWILATK